MNNFIEVGKIINTFGIKGELKVASDFEYKERIFIKEFSIYIGEEKIEEKISTHRVHKGYNLITFLNYSNINEVLNYKGKKIFINRKDLNLNECEYLLSDLIGFSVFDDNILLGTVIDYEFTKSYVLLKVKGEKTFYIPNVPNYINSINLNEKVILTNKGSELII